MTNKQNSKITAALSIGVIFIILLVIIAIGVFTLPKKQTATPQSPPSPSITITITPSGFDPASFIVEEGTVITWVNNDDKPHQVAANPHPTGTSLPGLRSEILNNQQTYSYTANKTGSFGYHDQLNPTTNGQFEVKDSAATKDKEE